MRNEPFHDGFQINPKCNENSLSKGCFCKVSHTFQEHNSLLFPAMLPTKVRTTPPPVIPHNLFPAKSARARERARWGFFLASAKGNNIYLGCLFSNDNMSLLASLPHRGKKILCFPWSLCQRGFGKISKVM